MVSLTVYDGAMGIGGNKLYLEEDGKGVFLDFGKNFGKYGIFYEEFLKNRDTRGIHDLMYLDLLPKLNIYRPDLIPADLSISQYPARSMWLQSFSAMPTCITAGTSATALTNSGHRARKIIMKYDLGFEGAKKERSVYGLYILMDGRINHYIPAL